MQFLVNSFNLIGQTIAYYWSNTCSEKVREATNTFVMNRNGARALQEEIPIASDCISSSPVWLLADIMPNEWVVEISGRKYEIDDVRESPNDEPSCDQTVTERNRARELVCQRKLLDFGLAQWRLEREEKRVEAEQAATVAEAGLLNQRHEESQHRSQEELGDWMTSPMASPLSTRASTTSVCGGDDDQDINGGGGRGCGDDASDAGSLTRSDDTICHGDDSNCNSENGECGKRLESRNENRSNGGKSGRSNGNKRPRSRRSANERALGITNSRRVKKRQQQQKRIAAMGEEERGIGGGSDGTGGGGGGGGALPERRHGGGPEPDGTGYKEFKGVPDDHECAIMRKAALAGLNGNADGWNSLCHVCASSEGELVCCDMCNCVWHLGCLSPPLSEVPSWLFACCALCVEEVEKGLRRHRKADGYS